MRRSDSALLPLTDQQFDIGLRAIDADIARGRSAKPLGLDLLAFVRP